MAMKKSKNEIVEIEIEGTLEEIKVIVAELNLTEVLKFLNKKRD
jgi:ribosomal protein L25 (general stress protein Ctc)